MKSTLAIASHYAQLNGDPEPYLERIAAAGFTHLLWGHHAWHDFVYVEPEIRHIYRCLQNTGLRVNDLHSSCGKEKNWGSAIEYQRLAGVEIIKNRIEAAACWGCDVVVLHVPREPLASADVVDYWDRQRRTMDALGPWAVRHKVRLALENAQPGNFDTIERFLADYGPEFLGFCYDCGHGNVAIGWPGNGLERMDRIKHRLIDLHLHDNDGKGDHHALPFTGTVDWARLAKLIAASAYGKNVIPLEVGLSDPTPQRETQFLHDALQAGRRLAAMVETAASELPQKG
jgi:sugar phosphate isomerase/epimerase